MLKNKYEIVGDQIKLYLDRRNKEPLITLVDLDVFEKLVEANVKWSAKWDEDIQSYYAQASQYLGIRDDGKGYRYKTLYLHKFVLDYNGKNKVDHINHDTLDNRNKNLRISLDENNSRNRNGANRNNTSGYRNVTWDKSNDKWLVQLQINKKNTRLGSFDDVHEAGKFAAEMREKYYGKYKGMD